MMSISEKDQPYRDESALPARRPTFQVQSAQHLGKKAWIIVRFEPDFGPVMVGIHYSDPALALKDANRLNVQAAVRANA